MWYLGGARARLLLTRTRIKSLPLPPEETGASGPYEASDENKKLLEVLTSEIWKRQVSSSENFDKSVLTLSSGGLAFSLGFLKDFLPVSQAVWGWTLYVSWSALTAATVVTMLSFLAAAKAQDYKLASARLYYLDGDDSRLNDHRWDRAVIWMNRVSGACFVVGVILTTVFVATNLERANDMKNQRPGIGQDGLPSPMMQKISNAGDLRRGLPSPAITPSSPARPVSAPAPAPASTTHSVPVKK